MKKQLYILTFFLIFSQALSASSISSKLGGGVPRQSQKADKFDMAGALVAESIAKDVLSLAQDTVIKHKAVLAQLLKTSFAPMLLHKLSPQQLDNCKEILGDIAVLAQETNLFSDKAQELLVKELIADVKKACLLAAKERNPQNITPCFMQEMLGALPTRWNSVVQKMKADNPAAYEKVCAYQKKWEPMIADIVQSIVAVAQQEQEELTQSRSTEDEQDQVSEQLASLMEAIAADERFDSIDLALGAVMPLLRTPTDGMQLSKGLCNALEKNPTALIQAVNAFKIVAVPVICQIAIDALDQIKKEQCA